MTKIVFFDIDGTLVNKRNTIPDSTKRAVKKLKENGVIPVIATGRAPLLIDDIREELAIDSYIAMNGQLVMHKGNVLFHNPIQTETVDRLTDKAVNQKNGIILCGAKDIYSNSIVSLAKRSSVWSILKGLGKIVPGHLQLSLFKKLIRKPPNPKQYEGKSIYQVILETSMEEETAYKDAFPELHFARSNHYTVDIISAGISKATGIEVFLKELGISQSETYGFGDSPNDLEMLEYVQTGVAMDNGWDSVKEVADYVTASVDEDGIEKGLRHFNLI
ncbi:MAG: Cof-type HAD-IIB family hydrolase [Alkalibacterium sp.]|nr:Cof-type HAD-IIB family hydrolase [Alkalibacterium sp.]